MFSVFTMRISCVRNVLPVTRSTRSTRRLCRLVGLESTTRSVSPVSSLRSNRNHFSSLLSSGGLALPNQVKIVEVGPRDGLQNEAVPVSTENKIALITKLAEAGCSFIEAGSFVSPKWVPSMADSKEVMEGLNVWRAARRCDIDIDIDDKHKHKHGLSDSSPVFSCLVPNLAGLQQAIEVQADEIAIFGSASEAFSQKVSG
jgi:isopropylmalate/homocitrate/citramalate synthase